MPQINKIYPENALEQVILTPNDYGFKEIDSASFSRYTKNWRAMPPHTHPGCLEICYCRRGSLRFECAGRHYDLLPDNIFLAQPSDQHRLTTNHKGVICYWLVFRYPTKGQRLFSLPHTESRALDSALRTLDKHLFAADTELRRLFKEVFAIVTTQPSPLRTLKLREVFLRILLLIIESSNNQPGLHGLRSISYIAQLIAKRPTHSFTTAELAAHAKLSESRFTALFRQVVGLPPHAYLLNCRLNAAQKRLRETNDSIQQIANDLGFVSSQHLSNLFRKTFRTTPTAFRTSCLAAAKKKRCQCRKEFS